MSEEKNYVVYFDFSMEMLRKNYNAQYPENAYNILRRFLEKNGFHHHQGSVYHTDHETLKIDVIEVFDKMFEKYKWMEPSLRSCSIAELGREYDLLNMVQWHGDMPMDQKNRFITSKKDVIVKKHRNKDDFFL